MAVPGAFNRRQPGHCRIARHDQAGPVRTAFSAGVGRLQMLQLAQAFGRRKGSVISRSAVRASLS